MTLNGGLLHKKTQLECKRNYIVSITKYVHGVLSPDNNTVCIYDMIAIKYV